MDYGLLVAIVMPTLAVAGVFLQLGRILQRQDDMATSLTSIEGKVDKANGTVREHSISLAEIRTVLKLTKL